ncbi:hypothetical protein SAMN05519104_6683 [Rhizobiales bacterium GAS188]|nr:hypothetical protein SAMN05519104_6683 [Rhizobiales bacterium GAS188]
MAKVDKYTSSTQASSYLAIILAITSLFLAGHSILTSWHDLYKVRQLLAYWLVCDGLQEEAEVGRAFNNDITTSKFDLPEDWKTGRIKYYAKLGLVTLIKRLNEYNVSIANPSSIAIPSEDQDELSVFINIPDMIDWTITIKQNDSLSRLFVALPDSTVDLSKKLQSLLDEMKAGASPEELKAIHPSFLDARITDPRLFSLGIEKYKTALYIIQYFGSFSFDPENAEQLMRGYRSFETKIYSTQIKIPLVDLTLTVSFAFWSLTIMSSIASVVTATNASILKRVISEPREEPWFVLDARGVISSAVAIIWLLVASFSPIVAISAHASYLISGIIAGDIPNSLFAGAVAALFVVAVFSSRFAWLSFRSLRDARQIALRT